MLEAVLLLLSFMKAHLVLRYFHFLCVKIIGQFLKFLVGGNDL
jgi:hypothetical protein